MAIFTVHPDFFVRVEGNPSSRSPKTEKVMFLDFRILEQAGSSKSGDLLIRLFGTLSLGPLPLGQGSRVIETLAKTEFQFGLEEAYLGTSREVSVESGDPRQIPEDEDV